jgi:hypothetical protein
MIARIRQASPQIEDVISLFVSYHFDDEEGIELPLQRNLDQMTLKFLVKSDLQKSVLLPPGRTTSPSSATASSRPPASPGRENSSSS